MQHGDYSVTCEDRLCLCMPICYLSCTMLYTYSVYPDLTFQISEIIKILQISVPDKPSTDNSKGKEPGCSTEQLRLRNPLEMTSPEPGSQRPGA